MVELRGRGTDRLERFCSHRCRNAQVNRRRTRWDDNVRFHEHETVATCRLTAARRLIFGRERQFEPVSEAGLLWAVWSDVDWPDAVWS
jgi:hypothetical protein